MNKTIEQKINNLEHQNQVILKGIEEIKKHLWKSTNPSSPNNLVNDNLIQHQEQQAIKYVEEIIVSKSQQIGIKGFWQGAILNYLQQQALNFVGTALKQLAIKHLIDLANWLLENLQDYLLEQYKKANSEEKELFKQKILEKFPDSKLAKELKGGNYE
jgi:hypothetical protein